MSAAVKREPMRAWEDVEEQLTDNKSVSLPRWQWRALRRLAYRQEKSLSGLIAEATRPLVASAQPRGGQTS